MSAPELALCCGQVAAVNGGGHVARSNKFGVLSKVAPKRLPLSRFQVPGMRKLENRKPSTRRNLSVTCTVTPKSAFAAIRRELEGPLTAPPAPACALPAPRTLHTNWT